MTTTEELFCTHPKITLHKSAKYTYINCAKCLGYLTQFRNDLPESRNFDLLIAKKLYIFGEVEKLTDEQLRRWR